MATDAELGAAFGTAGVSGLRQTGGVLQEEWHRSLQGRRGVSVYTEMGDTPILGGVLLAVETMLRSVQWSVDRAESTAQQAELVESSMHDMGMSWIDFVIEALTKLQYGWSWMEVVYKRRQGVEGEPPSEFDDGLVGWKEIAPRSQDTLERWELGENDELLGMWQVDSQGRRRFVSRRKALHFRTTHRKQSPEGRSIFRPAYPAYYYKRRIEENEAIGVERDLAGIPVFGIPPELFAPDASAAQVAAREEWYKIGRNLRKDEQACIVYPFTLDPEARQPTTKVELLSAPGGKQYNTTIILQQKNAEMAMSTLQDVITLGHEHVGSLALAKVKRQLAMNSLRAQLDEMAAELNRVEVRRLNRLNGFGGPYPRLVPGELEHRDLEQLADNLMKVATAGVLFGPDEELEAQIRRLLGLVDRPMVADEVFVPSGSGLEVEVSPEAELPNSA